MSALTTTQVIHGSRVRRAINCSPDPTDLITTNYATLKRRFLVELRGRMLMVERVMHHEWKRGRSFAFHMVPRTWRNEFEVFEADFEQSQWSKVTTIGDDQVLFLRRQCCRFVCVSKYKILGNRIFFLGDVAEDGMDSVDDDGNRYPEESFDPCRVFDMRDRKVSNSQPSITWNSSTALATWLFPQGQE